MPTVILNLNEESSANLQIFRNLGNGSFTANEPSVEESSVEFYTKSIAYAYALSIPNYQLTMPIVMLSYTELGWLLTACQAWSER